MKRPQLYLALFDLHYPKVHRPTLNAVLAFLADNKVDGFIFGGDQLDFEEISHHTKGKPLLRPPASYAKNVSGFDREVLTPIEKHLPKDTKRVYIFGNHERFETDLIEEQPELKGLVDHAEILKLEKRGWELIPLGHCFKLGKLNIVHGEILTGIGNQAGAYPARKALELYAGNVLAGHTHAPQTFTKVSPVEASNKWQAHIAPIAGQCNPGYLRNRPTAWLNGFVIIEVHPDGETFNLYSVIVIKGQFSYGGKLYSA